MVRTTVDFARRYAGFALAVLLVVSACGARSPRGSAHAASSRPTCSRYASPDGRPELARASAARARHHHHRNGSLAHPFGSVQRLVNALRPGETGCLEPGTYHLHGQLTFRRSGRAGAPVTLTSAHDQTARLIGGPVYVPNRSQYVTISHVHINTKGIDQVGVQILGAYDSLTYSHVTNHDTHFSCIIIGSDTGYGQASHTLIEGDVIYECGYNPADPIEDHGIYVDNSVDATIQNNVIWGVRDGWGIQLYPHSVGTHVLRNTIVDNTQGVIFAGDHIYTSSGNLVAYNIITSDSRGYDLQSYWGGKVGRNNVAEHNCLYSRRAEVQRPTKGFVATDNMITHPHYVNPTDHDYALRHTSPCRSLVG